MRQCRGKLGIQVGSSTFTDIDYADDAVLQYHIHSWSSRMGGGAAKLRDRR